MPATEQTWRNLKTLHVVFGISALAMLLISVWMLASDHNREAKALQKRFGAIETKFLEWRKNEQTTTEYTTKKVQLAAKVEAARSVAPDETVVKSFVDEANARAQANGYNLTKIESLETELKADGKVRDDLLDARKKLLKEQQDDEKKAAEEKKPIDEQKADARKQQLAANEAELKAAGAKIAAKRDEMFAAMQQVVNRAQFIENESQRKLKFTKADLDVENSKLGIGVDEALSPEQLAKIQSDIDKVGATVNGANADDKTDLTSVYQSNKTHRIALFNALTALKAEETDAQKEVDKNEADIKRLETAIKEKEPSPGRTFLEMPVVDAFGGPLKPAQIWLPELTWNNNFRNVARFDRCVTCHQGIEKTAPGSAISPAYEAAHDEKVALATPKTAPAEAEDSAKQLNDRLQLLYGMRLSPSGLLNDDDVTVEAVFAGGAAIQAGLKGGDIISRIGGVAILDLDMADNYLTKTVEWGKPLDITIRRGLPHPYASHPRLDLFVGSMSPHKIGEFGCTICHEGQGNATAFKWASHTPNDPNQANKWQREQGWFNNHHWIYPMLPTRFQEANCLKCHHDVTELKPSERFPEPPAPKLVAGFETIENIGCFGCHEINGYDGPKKRRGPDLRAEPNYFAAAQQVMADPKLQTPEKGTAAQIADLAKKVMTNPDFTRERKLLAELIVADAKDTEAKRAAAKQKIEAAKDAADKAAATKAYEAIMPSFGADTYSVASILAADDEAPGKYPKVGPSLRYVAAKNDLAFLNDWIKNPRNFRPSTKMPRFFGLHDHLMDVEKVVDGKTVKEKSKGRADAEKYEPVEILAISTYLMDKSQPFKYLDAPKTAADGKTIAAASADRGKQAFQTRGCLACHSHKDFPGINQTQGPDLSGIGAKLTGERGKKWLYSWLKQPNLYHARTVMPNLFLDPITTSVPGADGAAPTVTTTDPAADIAAFLGADVTRPGDKEPWKAEAVPTLAGREDAVNELLKLYLVGAFTKSEADAYIKTGIPASRKSQIKGDERILIVDAGETWSDEKKLNYLGKKSIGRLGCAGCHDIPGFEDAKAIGTGLADWGRKEPSKLAFEQILAYLHSKDGHGAAGAHSAADKAHAGDTHGKADDHAKADAAHAEAPKETAQQRLDKGFFMEALGHHQREGFIWQKLREPRSYDYMKTENKSYIDRLRMPQFNLSDEQREAIMTFVLGLVAEPPPAKYVYQPNPRQEAILAGARVIEKFNCAGCHTLQQQQWKIGFKPGSVPPSDLSAEYPFLIPHFTPEQIAKSKAADRRGLGHVMLHGIPQPKDDEEEPTKPFQLWSPILADGQTVLSGGAAFMIDEAVNPPGSIEKWPQRGGILANYLHPVAMDQEKKVNPNVKASDVWGFLPPPLMGEGKKVQPRWLHDFLLDPHLIRPSVVLRMPKFNLTSAESEAIVNHFAAVDNVDFPYEFDERTRTDYVAAKNAEYQKANGGGAGGASPADDDKRLNDALKLVTDSAFCIKCHRIGDFAPQGALAAQAPNLAVVNQRLRPEYLRDWIANPGRILPYTGMPVNFPYTGSVAQHLYKGTSEEQVNAVVDLLLNYDNVLKRKTSMAEMVKANAPPAPGGAAAPAPGASGAATTPAASSSPSAASSATQPKPTADSPPKTTTPAPGNTTAPPTKPADEPKPSGSVPKPSTPTPPGSGATPTPGTSSTPSSGVPKTDAKP